MTECWYGAPHGPFEPYHPGISTQGYRNRPSRRSRVSHDSMSGRPPGEVRIQAIWATRQVTILCAARWPKQERNK